MSDTLDINSNKKQYLQAAAAPAFSAHALSNAALAASVFSFPWTKAFFVRMWSSNKALLSLRTMRVFGV
jgi:hypothetical protein